MDHREDSERHAITETKIDHICDQLALIRADQAAFNTRITALERWRAWLLGAGAVVAAGFGTVVGWLKHGP